MMQSDESEAPAVEEGAPAWMATFANMDVIKFSAAVGSLRDAFGTRQVDPGELESFAPTLIRLSEDPSTRAVQVIDLPKRVRAAEADLLRRIQLMMATHELEKLVEAEQTERGVVVRVLLFDPGSARLRPEAFVVLREISELVRDVDNAVSIEGHTDDAPIRTAEFPSNWHLSADRAIAALEYLAEVEQIEPRRLSAAGFADMDYLGKGPPSCAC